MMGTNIYSVYYTDKLMITMIEQQIIINHPLSPFKSNYQSLGTKINYSIKISTCY